MVLIMNQKKVLLIFSLIFMSLFSHIVFAQDGAGAGLAEAFGTIEELFAFLPELVTLENLIGGKDPAALFWAKFLVWLLLFAAIYFGTSKVFKDNNRIAVIIALVISLMGTLLMPVSILFNIFQTYGLLAGIIIWVIPVIGGMWIAHKVENRFFKAFIYGTSAWILFSINETIVKEQGFVNTSFPYFVLLMTVVIILFFVNLFAMFGGGEGAVSEHAGRAGRSIWDRITRGGDDDGRRRRRRGGGEPPDDDHDDDDDERDVDNAEIRAASGILTKVNSFNTKLKQLSNSSFRDDILDNLIKPSRSWMRTLGRLTRKEIKIEQLTEKHFKDIGASTAHSHRRELEALIKEEVRLLKNIQATFNNLKTIAESVPGEGEPRAGNKVPKATFDEGKKQIFVLSKLLRLLILVNRREIGELS